MSRKRVRAALFLAILTIGGQRGLQGEPVLRAEVWGLQIDVQDIEEAVHFYTKALGFTDEGTDSKYHGRLLMNGTCRLILRHSTSARRSPEHSRVSLNLRVADLDGAVRAVQEAGGIIVAPASERNQIGWHRLIGDPSGNRLNLMDITGNPLEPGSPPVVFNMSFRVEDMAEAEAYYRQLGFSVFSRDYLPATLPFQRAGGISLVLHPAEAKGLGTPSDPILILRTSTVLWTLPEEALRRSLQGLLLRAPSGNLLLLSRENRAGQDQH